MKTFSETSETTLNSPTFILYRSQREKIERGPEKIFEEIIAKNFLTWERKHSLKSKKCRESHTQ